VRQRVHTDDGDIYGPKAGISGLLGAADLLQYVSSSVNVNFQALAHAAPRPEPWSMQNLHAPIISNSFGVSNSAQLFVCIIPAPW
jgi:hypothetical protein